MVDLLNPKAEDIPPRKYKLINNKKVAYRETGNGPVIFCIPPWPSSSLAYFQISELLKEEYKVIAVDLPGFGGESEWLGEFSLDKFGVFVKDFIESFSIKNYYVIGYSFGGMLTQYCIGKSYINPKRVLYVSSLHSADDVWMYGKKYFEFSSLTRNVISDLNNLKRFVEWVYMIKWKVENRTRNDLLTSGLFNAILQEDELADVNVILPMWEELKDTNTLHENLKHIPSMVIYGNKDPLFIQNECKELAQYLNITPIIVDGDHDHFAFYARISLEHIKYFFKKRHFAFIWNLLSKFV